MRIRCFGYLDEGLSSIQELIELMQQVQAGKLDRPEIELFETDDQAGTIIHIAGLFREGSGDPAGWLVSARDPVSGKNHAFCLSSGECGIRHENVLFCGSPQTVDQAAILGFEQVVELVEQLMDCKPADSFVRRQFVEIIA